MARRTFSTEQKIAIVRRHLVDKVPVSDLCDEYKLQPSVLYGWLTQLFENLPAAFEARSGTAAPAREKQLAAKIERMRSAKAVRDESTQFVAVGLRVPRAA